MANVLTSQPMKLDTGGATVLLTDPIYPAKVRWVSKAATAGDEVLLKDAAGNVKWHSVAGGSNYVEESHFLPDQEHSWVGLTATTIGSGTVYIYTA
jgi:hypothetical protein